MAIITRADTLTNQKKKLEYFSDFFDNFDRSPFGPELARVTNEKSVNQSIRNLIKTNFGDRPFQSNLGCNVTASLFELTGVILQNLVQDSITATINSYEPRVVLESVTVSDMFNPTNYSAPADIDKNTVEITIVYYLINNPNPISLTVFLRRVR